MIRVSLVFSPAARQVEELALALEPGTTLAQALERSGLALRFPELARMPLPCRW